MDVGDVIRVTPRVKIRWAGAQWTEDDLIVSGIIINRNNYSDYLRIQIWVNGQFHFFLNEKGEHENYETYGQFFEIISLKED